MNLPLNDICRLFETAPPAGGAVPVMGCAVDSRRIREGYLFFALAGERADGHDFLEDAFRRGAAAAVVSRRSGRTSSAGPVLSVDDPLSALQTLAAHYRSLFTVPVIAVTGTNGKTTAKEMLSAVLAKKYTVAATPGNYNNHIGLPLSILSWDPGIEIAVLEMGMNHFGEIRALCRIARPTHGLITNIGKGHLEHLHDLQGVARAKSELLEWLAEQTDGTAFLNGDDPLLRERLGMVNNTVSYGFSAGCSLRGELLPDNDSGFPVMSVEGRRITIPVPGAFNLTNGLAAAAAGRAFGIGWDEITDALCQFSPAKNRMNVIRIGSSAVIDDSYNANPGSMEGAFAAAAALRGYRRKIAVLGDMAELGGASEPEHRQLGTRIAAGIFQAFFAFGPGMKLAAEAARNAHMEQVFWYESQTGLLKAVGAFLKDGDLVLVKGSRSMAMDIIADKIRQLFTNRAECV